VVRGGDRFDVRHVGGLGNRQGRGCSWLAQCLEEMLGPAGRPEHQYASLGRAHLEPVRHAAGTEHEITRPGNAGLSVAEEELDLALEKEERLVPGAVDVHRTVGGRREARIDRCEGAAGRPLEEMYPIVYLDALVVKVYDGHQVRNKVAHTAPGVVLIVG
jgi:hypothetical protein